MAALNVDNGSENVSGLHVTVLASSKFTNPSTFFSIPATIV
jgi:hypothetical protein